MENFGKLWKALRLKSFEDHFESEFKCKMADLPVEIWHTILDRLELIDLSSCALVSKALYCAVKSYRVREIAFTRRVYKWFHQDFSIYRYRVDCSMASLLIRSSFNLERLKRLQIGRSSIIDSLNEINKFAHLEELDIDLAYYKNEKSRTLSIANLKMFRLCMSNHLSYLELDTPSLAEVCTFSLEKLDFLFPDSIRCIRTLHHSEKLSMFPESRVLALHRSLQSTRPLPWLSEPQ